LQGINMSTIKRKCQKICVDDYKKIKNMHADFNIVDYQCLVSWKKIRL